MEHILTTNVQVPSHTNNKNKLLQACNKHI